MAANLILANLIAYLTAPVSHGRRGLLVPRWRRWSGNFGHWGMLFLYAVMILAGLVLILGAISWFVALLIWTL